VTTPQKFLLDECVSLPIVEALRKHVESLPDPATLTHIIELGLASQTDDEWIPRIAEEGWIVISGDKGKGGLRKGQKLKAVCVAFGVTHILVSASIQEKKVAEKIEIFTSAWEQIAATVDAEAGTRYSMRFDNAGAVILQKMRIYPGGSR
jgi:hypothetical protein